MGHTVGPENFENFFRPKQFLEKNILFFLVYLELSMEIQFFKQYFFREIDSNVYFRPNFLKIFCPSVDRKKSYKEIEVM